MCTSTKPELGLCQRIRASVYSSRVDELKELLATQAGIREYRVTEPLPLLWHRDYNLYRSIKYLVSFSAMYSWGNIL